MIKFMLEKNCFEYLNYSEQFPRKHQFKKLKNSASILFRCVYFNLNKCLSQIKFNFFDFDDSLEIISRNCCDHFRSINANESLGQDIYSNIRKNK